VSVYLRNLDDANTDNKRKVIFNGCNYECIMSEQELLKLKEKQNEQEATHIEEDTQRLVTEIEMLKVVLYLVSRKQQ
jgi:hypothetical protein